MEEVKRKQTEVGQLKDLLTSLEALREHRKETRRKGERWLDTGSNQGCVDRGESLIIPRCACASEVYGSVFVCLCVCVCV